MPSIFTKILAGQIPGEFVFQDDLWPTCRHPPWPRSATASPG
jgi:hypothetical protein